MDPEPSIDPHAPGEHTQDGSLGGHAQPVPNHIHAASLWHVVAVVNAAHGSPLSAGSSDVVECVAQPTSAITTAASRVIQPLRARSGPRVTYAFARRDTQNSVVSQQTRSARGERSGCRCIEPRDADLYTQARAGKVDLAISHYGHHEAEQFILDGLGEWPRTIFSNQVALVGPPSDPAGVRGLDDAGEALRRISTSGSPFIVNEIDGLSYLTDILWHLAGQPARTNWLHGHKHDDALIEAAKRNAYTTWGLTPFMRVRKREHLQLEPLVLGDPLFQRLLVSVVIKPKVGGVNVAGATAFEQFLLEPSTQALMRTIDYSDDHTTKLARWMPAGRHNRVAVLRKSKLA